MRQPGVADVAAQPFSLLGNFALEGIALSLAWLGLLVSGCVALLRGAIVITPGTVAISERACRWASGTRGRLFPLRRAGQAGTSERPPGSRSSATAVATSDGRRKGAS